MKHLVAPSILAANFAYLGNDIKLVNESESDWIHIDVMDGRFVPNISIGIPVVSAIKSVATKPLDVHLMIVEPEKYIVDFQKAGADILTVHYEASTHLHSSIHAIKDNGMKAGVALNPHTSINVLKEVIKDLDVVVIMSVNPGFGGQKFITQSLVKIKELKELILQTNSSALIEVDGGVSMKNAGQILNAGADVLVAGSSVFKSDNPNQAITELKQVEVNTINV